MMKIILKILGILIFKVSKRVNKDSGIPIFCSKNIKIFGNSHVFFTIAAKKVIFFLICSENLSKILGIPLFSLRGVRLVSVIAQSIQLEVCDKIKLHLDMCSTRDDHQNLKLLSIDLNQMHLIGLVERTILVFKSSKSDVSLQSYGL